MLQIKKIIFFPFKKIRTAEAQNAIKIRTVEAQAKFTVLDTPE